MASTRPPLAKSPKKPTKDVNEMETIRRNVSPMTINEAISSAAKNPALQHALEVIRSGGTQARKRKAIAEGKSKIIAPKSMEIKNKGATSSIGILTTIPEDEVIIPPIKSFEIDNMEKSFKKGKHFHYEGVESPF